MSWKGAVARDLAPAAAHERAGSGPAAQHKSRQAWLRYVEDELISRKRRSRVRFPFYPRHPLQTDVANGCSIVYAIR